MYVVAICKLVSSIEDEADALARNLGSTAYEERLNLVAGLPAIVLMTVDREKASALLGKIRARGQGAIAFDANNVVPIDRMVRPRMFTIGFDELFTRDAAGLAPAPGQMGGEMDPSGTRSLPFADILAIVRATHRISSETRAEVKERGFSAGRALLTGGLMLTKTTTKEKVTSSSEHQQIAIFFRASGDTPWVLFERGTNYTGLGAEMAPASAESFRRTVAKIRERATSAEYDERLASPRPLSGRIVGPAAVKGGTTTQSTAGAIELLSHSLAVWIRRQKNEELR